VSKDRKADKGARGGAASESTERADSRERPESGGHGRAHGIPLVEPSDLPSSREELLALHAVERRRRAEASLGGPEFRAASQRLAEIEIRIARIERSLDPPRV
jgi:hypothetical protein